MARGYGMVLLGVIVRAALRACGLRKLACFAIGSFANDLFSGAMPERPVHRGPFSRR